MDSRQEILAIELERTMKGICYKNPKHNPFPSLDENTSIHTKKVPHDLRFYRTAAAGAQQSRKPSMFTNVHMRAEKENVESGSPSPRSHFIPSKGKASNAQPKKSASLLGFTDVNRLQEVWSKPLSQRELNVLNGAGGKQDISIAPEFCGGLPATFMEGSQSLHSQRTHLIGSLEEFVCAKPECSQESREQPLTVLVQERIHETCDPPQIVKSLKAAPLFPSTESMEAPLLRQFQERSENENFCVEVRDDKELDSPCDRRMRCLETADARFDQSKGQHIESSTCRFLGSSTPSHYTQDSSTYEASNMDHVVVLFSVQKFLQENASTVNRHKLSKLPNLCALYSRKFLCWVTRVCREQNIANCMRCIRQIFSPSRRGFVELKSQKLPEFSTKISSPSNKKKLAKDNELRAVLLKINEVLASMERTSSDTMQIGNRSSASHG